jgi:hypothetical protein
MVHAAANLITGEILTSNHANHLKRRVSKIAHWDYINGYSNGGEWVFAHGENWVKILGDKFAEHSRQIGKVI